MIDVVLLYLQSATTSSGRSDWLNFLGSHRTRRHYGMACEEQTRRSFTKTCKMCADCYQSIYPILACMVVYPDVPVRALLLAHRAS